MPTTQPSILTTIEASTRPADVSMEPSSCTNVVHLTAGNGDYTVNLEYNSTAVNVLLSANVSTSRYIAVGFTDTPSMVSTVLIPL